MSIGRKEAAKYIEDYFKTYPGIKTFLDDTVAHAKEMGYVVTLFGRRRPVPELSSSNFMQRSFGERVAMNAPIQGTAADIMKIAMIGVNRRLKEQNLKSRLVLQVHDELLIEAYRPELPEVEKNPPGGDGAGGILRCTAGDRYAYRRKLVRSKVRGGDYENYRYYWRSRSRKDTDTGIFK